MFRAVVAASADMKRSGIYISPKEPKIMVRRSMTPAARAVVWMDMNRAVKGTTHVENAATALVWFCHRRPNLPTERAGGEVQAVLVRSALPTISRLGSGR